MSMCCCICSNLKQTIIFTIHTNTLCSQTSCANVPKLTMNSTHQISFHLKTKIKIFSLRSWNLIKIRMVACKPIASETQIINNRIKNNQKLERLRNFASTWSCNKFWENWFFCGSLKNYEHTTSLDLKKHVEDDYLLKATLSADLSNKCFTLQMIQQVYT